MAQTQQQIEQGLKFLGRQGLLFPDTQDISKYQIGARGEQGVTAFIMRPDSTENVSKAVAFCIKNNIHIIPQAANTGLVSGSITDNSGMQAILSVERLNKTLELNCSNRSVKVGAGISLSQLNTVLEKDDLFFPIDLGADPMIGGMVATNTGGARFLKYGDVRKNLLGLKVVLPDEQGTILDLSNSLRKNNTGVDWKQLFVGTSGAFGIVAECDLNLELLPKQTAAALLVPSSTSAIFSLLMKLEERLGNQLSAFEFMSDKAMQHAFAHAPSINNAFENGHIPPIALLIEVSRTWVARKDEPTLNQLLETHLSEIWEEEDLLKDALFGRAEDMWSLRHSLSEGVKNAGKLYAFDISFERQTVMEFRDYMQQHLVTKYPELEICDFGHVGDGGLHFNLISPHKNTISDPNYETELRDWVIGIAVDDFGGSFSAEHALGPKNQCFYDKYTNIEIKKLSDKIQKSFLSNPLGTVTFGEKPTIRKL